MKKCPLLLFVLLGVASHASELEFTNPTSLIQRISSTPVAGVAALGEGYIAVGRYGDIYQSTNLKNWTFKRAFDAALFEDEIEYVYGVYSDGTGIFVYGGGFFRYTTDGDTWIDLNSTTSRTIDNIAFGGSTYLATGSQDGDAALFISSDGMAWSRLSQSKVRPRRVIHAAGQFWGVRYGSIYFSPDGLKWSSVEVCQNNPLRGIAWDGFRFVTYSDRKLYVSDSGMSGWVQHLADQNLEYHSVGASPSGGLIASTDHGLWASDTDQVWLLCYSNFSNQFKILTAGNQVMALDHYGTFITTDDPFRWRHQIAGQHWSISNLAGDGDQLYVEYFDTLYQSSDGLEWWSLPIPGPLGRTFGQGKPPVISWQDQLLVAGEGVFYLRDEQTAWQTIPFPSGVDDINDVIRGEDQFVATVVGTGDFATSPDGISWTVHEANAIGDPWFIIHGDSVYLSADQATLLLSDNGRDWHRALLPDSVKSVAWTGDRFVVAGYDNLVMTSPAGVNWTKIPWNADHSIRDINAFQEEVYVIGSRPGFDDNLKGVGMVSPDMGETWINEGFVNGHRIVVDMFSSEQGFIFDHFSSMTITQDMETWWMINKQAHFQNVIWDGSQYVGTGEAHAAVSEDGLAWSRHRFFPKADWVDMAHGKGVSVAVGIGIWRSSNGMDWEQIPDIDASFLAVTHNGEQFVAVGKNQVVFRSENGEQWEEVRREKGDDLSAVIWTADHFVAAAHQRSYVLRSTDAVIWETVSLGDAVVDGDMENIGETILIRGRTGGRQIISSFDGGLTWSVRDVDFWVRNFSTHGDFFIASYLDIVHTSVDGLTWRKVPRFTGKSQRGFESAGDKLFMISEYETTLITPVLSTDRWWQDLSSWPTESTVTTLLGDPCFLDVVIQSRESDHR